MDWRGVALVALGGALGCLARFGVAGLLGSRAFPWATLAVNLVGSLAIGYLLLGHGVAGGARQVAVIGFLGGLTTMSAYSAETVALLRDGQGALALANLMANALGGPLAAFAGWRLAA